MAEKEYISREALIAAAREYDLGGSYDNTELAVPVSIIRSIPAADVRPVVLCRDCERYTEIMYGGTRFGYGFCDRWADGTRMNPDEFCSRGEKREES